MCCALGDDRQLSAVESGGALRLIAHDVGAAELTVLYRFTDPAEAAATVKLRAGDASGLDYYLARSRVRSGSREAMTEAAYAGWRADMLAGRTTVMTAASGTDVTALSAQARAERVDAGQVEPGGVALRDGTLAGRGDWIVTRQNNCRLAVHGGRDWVKNGDAWRVITRHRNGALRVEHLGHRGRVTLPAEYVAGQVQLLYASTAHRVQGTTVDTAHALITPEMSRESFYVVASRARQATTFYTATHDLLPPDEDERPDAARTDPRSYAAREVLENVLAREGTELSATETIRDAQDQAGSLATLVPRYQHAAQLLADARYRRVAVDVLGEGDGGLLVADPAWGAVVRALVGAEATGWQPGPLLAEVAGRRELGTARSIGEVIAWRIDAHITDRAAPPRLDQPIEADATRYAGLLRELPCFRGATFDPAFAVSPPSPWPPRSSREPGTGRPAAEAAEAVVARVLGADLAGRAQAEPAWAALEAAVRRAQRGDHDPGQLLGWVARSRELRTARSLSEVLAWRIGRYLAAGEGSVGETKPGKDARELDSQTWAMLAWTLKAAENRGHDVGEAIAAAARAPDPASAVLAVTRGLATHRPASSLPPWIAEAPASETGGSEADRQIAAYLNDVAEVIRARVRSLAGNAVQARPAWVNALGAVRGEDARHPDWLHHVGVVAAYRDQCQVSSDDPRQVLGPCAEPGHAGHTAYWHAAASVLAARTIAGLELADPRKDEVSAQVAADLYRGLPAAEQAAVGAAMAERLGVLWFGPRSDSGDHAATRPIYAAQLATVLAERGHLSRQLATKATLAGGTAPLAAMDGLPVEADYARRRAGQRTGRDDPGKSRTWRARGGDQVRPSPGRVPAVPTSARPAEEDNGPMAPLRRHPDKHRGAEPVQQQRLAMATRPADHHTVKDRPTLDVGPLRRTAITRTAWTARK